MGSGIWGKRFRCEECRNNPKMQEAWGCTGKSRMSQPTFEETENGVHYRYWQCPVAFVPDSVKGFLILYRYCKDFPGVRMPPPSEVSARFLLAAQYYDAKLAENMQLKAEKG